MALNWVMLSPNRSPVPLDNEKTITTIDRGVNLLLYIPDSVPMGNATAGGSGGSRELNAMGKVWLTDQRVRLFHVDLLILINLISRALPLPTSFQQLIFASDTPEAAFDSLSVPLDAILSTEFKQPAFGSNHLKFEVKPADRGGLSHGTRAELRFKDRAMFEFISLLEKTRERAIYMKRTPAEEDDLPTYTSRAESSAGTPADNPPGYNA